MKIARLAVRNFLGIADVDLRPGHLNVISGGNAQGKTSMLKAIQAAFRGRGLEPADIRIGEDKAEILVELDNGTRVERVITEKEHPVQVWQEKALRPKPQQILDDLVGTAGFGFNPVEFFQADAKEQREILIRAVDVRMTTKDWEAALGDTGRRFLTPDVLAGPALEMLQRMQEKAYDERKAMNAEADHFKKAARVESERIPLGFDPAPYRHDVGDVYRTLHDLEQQLKNRSALAARLDTEKASMDVRDEAIVQAKERLARMEAEQEAAAKHIIELRQNMTAIDVTSIEAKAGELRDRLASFETGRKLAEALDRVGDLEKKAEDAADEAKVLDRAYKRLVKDVPRMILNRANLPIGDVQVKPDGVYLGDRPLRKLSTSEQLRFALDLARAVSGPLKVICLDGAEVLEDATYQAMMQDIGADDEHQYFVTEVTAGALDIRTEGR